MKRRELFTTMVATGLGLPALAAQNEHSHKPIDGPMANAIVSFGAWPQANDQNALAGNRFTTPFALPAPNVHVLTPYEATVKAGGTINFIVAGYHLIAVYAPGIALDDIDTTLIAAPLPVPPGPANQGPPLINDPEGRLYYGLDPRKAPLAANIVPPAGAPLAYSQDRVEVVQFPNPGRHLVICAVLPHFANDHMHGWVNVLP